MTAAPQLVPRSAPRFRIDLPVELEEGRGTTRDMGTGGVFFMSPHRYAPSTTLSFTIVLDSVNQAAPLRMRCSGEVVRVEDDADGMIGTAARILEYTIEAA